MKIRGHSKDGCGKLQIRSSSSTLLICSLSLCICACWLYVNTYPHTHIERAKLRREKKRRKVFEARRSTFVVVSCLYTSVFCSKLPCRALLTRHKRDMDGAECSSSKANLFSVSSSSSTSFITSIASSHLHTDCGMQAACVRLRLFLSVVCVREENCNLLITPTIYINTHTHIYIAERVEGTDKPIYRCIVL